MIVDIVVPSAYPLALLRTTLPALNRALGRSPSIEATVTVVDERPERDGLGELLRDLQFDHLVTGTASGGLGNGPARNRGAASGSAPFLLFMDDDVELDPDAFRELDEVQLGDHLATIGSLRAPDGSPRWLERTYEDTTMNPAAAGAGEALLPPAGLAVTLLLIRRDTFEAVGGFPELPVWGWVDLLFGLRLEAAFGPTPAVRRDPGLSGIHHFVPSWADWLVRQERAGARLAEVLDHLDLGQRQRALEMVRLDDSVPGVAKRAAGHIPKPILLGARGRLGRKLAAAASVARGFREAS